MSMQFYLSIHKASFHTDRSRIRFVGTCHTGSAQEWFQFRRRQRRMEGRKDRWDEFCDDLKKRYTDPNQADKNAHKMKQLKYNRAISAYLTRLQDLNLTVGLTGPFLRDLVAASMPNEILKVELYSRKGPIPQDDQGFLDAVLEAGRVYEDTLANSAVAKGEQSGSTRDQSKSDRRKEQSSASSSKSSLRSRGQRASAGTKGQIWSSKEEALQGIAQADIDKQKKANVSCLRCGRDKHDTLYCYAKRDVDGKDLPSPPTKAPAVAGGKRKADNTTEDSASTVSRCCHRLRSPPSARLSSSRRNRGSSSCPTATRVRRRVFTEPRYADGNRTACRRCSRGNQENRYRGRREAVSQEVSVPARWISTPYSHDYHLQHEGTTS